MMGAGLASNSLRSRLRRAAVLVGLFWSTSLAAEMEYRVNFVYAFASSALGLGASVYTIRLFFDHGASLGGWSWLESLVVMGLFTVLQGFSHALLHSNLNRIVEHVRNGTLDFILLKPIDTQFWLSLRRVSPWGLPDLCLGTVLIVLGAAHAHVTVWTIAALLGSLFCSLLILYSLWFLMATTTVWFVQIYNVTEVLRGLMDAGRFPIDAFPNGAYRILFSFVVPVAFMTTVPARALLGVASSTHLVTALGIAAGLFLATRRFFRFALRYYTSASS